MQEIVKYLNPELISFFQAPVRDEAIHHLVELCFKEGKIKESELFFKKVLEREKIVSTGIGMSVALPHAKLEGLNEFFIAIGVLSKGIDWQSLDGNPIRLIFLIGGPEDKQTEYLKILSTLTTLLKDENFRKKILTSNSPTAMMKLFTGVNYGSKAKRGL